MKWRVYKGKPLYQSLSWIAERDGICWYFYDWFGAYHWAQGWHRIDD